VYTQEYSPRCYLFSFTEQKPITEIFVEACEVYQDRNFNVEAEEAGEALKPPLGSLWQSLRISKTTKKFLPFRAFQPLFRLPTSLNKFTNLGSHDCESLWQPMLELWVANKSRAYIKQNRRLKIFLRLLNVMQMRNSRCCRQ